MPLRGHAAAAAKSLQSCPTLCDPMDCSLPGSSVHGIFQATVLEWGAIEFLRVLYIQIPKNSTQQLLEQISEFGKVAGYKSILLHFFILKTKYQKVKKKITSKY